MALQQNKDYAIEARASLLNLFPRISAKAIDAAICSSNSHFTRSFYFLSQIESRRSSIDGDGAGHFGLPPDIAVFIKQNRQKKSVQLSNRHLCKEIKAIEEIDATASHLSVRKKERPSMNSLASDVTSMSISGRKSTEHESRAKKFEHQSRDIEYRRGDKEASVRKSTGRATTNVDVRVNYTTRSDGRVVSGRVSVNRRHTYEPTQNDRVPRDRGLQRSRERARSKSRDARRSKSRGARDESQDIRRTSDPKGYFFVQGRFYSKSGVDSGCWV